LSGPHNNATGSIHLIPTKEATMHFSQSDLFWGMSIDFVKASTELAFHISCKEGEKLFDIGDKADRFYVLLKGSVTMKRGDGDLYTAQDAGEIFGWSSLIKRPEYAASATCDKETELLNIKAGPFLKLMDIYPNDKAVLFERLATMLGNQLLGVYISAIPKV
jgi:CRP-like cAMP-binding protein